MRSYPLILFAVISTIHIGYAISDTSTPKFKTRQDTVVGAQRRKVDTNLNPSGKPDIKYSTEATGMDLREVAQITTESLVHETPGNSSYGFKPTNATRDATTATLLHTHSLGEHSRSIPQGIPTHAAKHTLTNHTYPDESPMHSPLTTTNTDDKTSPTESNREQNFTIRYGAVKSTSITDNQTESVRDGENKATSAVYLNQNNSSGHSYMQHTSTSPTLGLDKNDVTDTTPTPPDTSAVLWGTDSNNKSEGVITSNELTTSHSENGSDLAAETESIIAVTIDTLDLDDPEHVYWVNRKEQLLKDAFGFIWQYPNWDYTRYVDINVEIHACYDHEGLLLSEVCQSLQFTGEGRNHKDTSLDHMEYILVDVRNEDDNIEMFRVKLNSSQMVLYKPWLRNNHHKPMQTALNPHFRRLSFDMVPRTSGFDLHVWASSGRPDWYLGRPLRLWAAVDGCHVSGIYAHPRDCRRLANLTTSLPPRTNFINLRFSAIPANSPLLQDIYLNIFALDYQVVFTVTANASNIGLYRDWLDINTSDRGPPIILKEDVDDNEINDYDTRERMLEEELIPKGEEIVGTTEPTPVNATDVVNMNINVNDNERQQNANGVIVNDSTQSTGVHIKYNDPIPLNSTHSNLNKTDMTQSSNGIQLQIVPINGTAYSNGTEVHKHPPYIVPSKSHSRENSSSGQLAVDSVVGRSPEHVAVHSEHSTRHESSPWERPNSKYTQAHLALMRKRGEPL